MTSASTDPKQQRHQHHHQQNHHDSKTARPTVKQILSLPPKCLNMYDDFIAKNAGQVSQIESALRSLTYIVPGRFRDAEIASESIHSGVQLLSLYHDTLLRRLSPSSSTSTSSSSSTTLPSSTTTIPTPHSRYTKFWTAKSKPYRRVAMLLQMVIYTELLCEMTAKRRGGDRRRWSVVVLLETIKAICRLILLRVTRSRPLVSPVLPEREIIPEDTTEDNDSPDATEDLAANEASETRSESELMDEITGPTLSSSTTPPQPLPIRPHEKEWHMPRTGLSLPSLPNPGNISTYLQTRVLTADDIKPAFHLLNRLRAGSPLAAEILHILSPLIYAFALLHHAHYTSRSPPHSSATSSTFTSTRRKILRSSWTPWVIGIASELLARQLRDKKSLRMTNLEREEWNRRAWAMGWWVMRGGFYENVTKGVVQKISGGRWVPGFVGGILGDYEYLWENYYFSTSA